MALGLYEEMNFDELPHPAIRLPVLLIVENAICAAWELLRSRPRPGFDLRTATEDVITFELHEALYDRVFNSGMVAGFGGEVFSTVEREPKLRSYDYSHLDKMPDLIIRLVGRPASIRPTQDGLFVECKPVDKKHPIRRHYCEKGLARFTSGQYAWAMSSAMMVGYADSNSHVYTSLTEALRDWPDVDTRTIVRPCARSSPNPVSEAVHLTEHPRMFKYVETKRQAPHIVIRHLWLRRA
jgi:hypothetical protein